MICLTEPNKSNEVMKKLKTKKRDKVVEISPEAGREFKVGKKIFVKDVERELWTVRVVS